MNENKEKKSKGGSAESPELLRKKIARFSAVIYLCLAISVVVVATVGIFSISYDFEESLPQIDFPQVDFTPEASEPAPESKPEIPVGGEESGVIADLSEPEPAPLYYRPVAGEISKPFSIDALVFSETLKDYRVHVGVDIGCELGAEVLCYTDGVVQSVSEDYFYGVTVAVSHADGLVSYYMNLDPTLSEGIAAGAELKGGDVIGKVGNTARAENADSPHLHFELRVEGELIDPETELPE